MAILPDHLRPGLSIVFCGTAVGTRSAQRGHYYSGTGNEFWRFIHEAGITPVRLMPEDDHRICEFRCGLTDLAKEIAASSDGGLKSHYHVAEFIIKIENLKPKWVAFHGKEAAKVVVRHIGHAKVIRLGIQSWRIGTSNVFVLPNASGANRDSSRLEGKSDRLEWFKELAMSTLSSD
jgi:TDG/mug DNA glycosylase family protein